MRISSGTDSGGGFAVLRTPATFCDHFGIEHTIEFQVSVADRSRIGSIVDIVPDGSEFNVKPSLPQ